MYTMTANIKTYLLSGQNYNYSEVRNLRVKDSREVDLESGDRYDSSKSIFSHAELLRGMLVMEFQDSGAGISSENQNRLFKEVVQFNPEKCNSFGTIPSVSANDKSTSIWNIFESAGLTEELDEHQQFQKQKYDTLKSQNKVIRFERRFVWAVMLNRHIKQISKSLMTKSVIDIY